MITITYRFRIEPEALYQRRVNHEWELDLFREQWGEAVIIESVQGLCTSPVAMPWWCEAGA